MKKVLLMGGTTFISEALAKYLISKDYEVDILTRGNKTLSYTGYKNHLVCNRKDEEALKEVLKDRAYDYICDISAYTGEDVRILINSIDKSSLKKYLFISSAAVYENSDIPSIEDDKLTESTEWGTYAVDKIEGEKILIESNLPHIIFRPPYIYGEGNNLYREAYIYHSIINKQEIPIPVGKDVKVQFLYIDDLVKAFEEGLKENYSGVYNLTNESSYSFLEFVNTCMEALEKTTKVACIDTNEIEEDVRSFFPFREVNLSLNIEKLKKSGLYVPHTDLKEGLKKSFKWIEETNPTLVDKRMVNIKKIIEAKTSQIWEIV